MHSIERFRALCEKALGGGLVLDDLGSAVTRDAKGSRFLASVLEDLEDAAEHFPLKPISHSPDWTTWNRTELRRRLFLDLVLLRSGVEPSRMAACREAVISRVLKRTDEEIEQQVNECLSA